MYGASVHSVYLQCVQFDRLNDLIKEIVDWIEVHMDPDVRKMNKGIITGLEFERAPGGKFMMQFDDPNLALLFKLRFVGYENG